LNTESEGKNQGEQGELIRALSKQLEEKERANQILLAQLAANEARFEEITGSLGWQLVNRYSWMKYYFSTVYRLLGLLLGQNVKAQTVHPLTKRPASVFPPPSTYDVICFPIINWNFRFQRPQQLLTQFANAGHRVFYLSTTFDQSGASILAQNIAENIYEIQLPGPAHVSLNMHKIDEQVLESLLGALDEFRRRAGIADATSLVHLPFWGPLAIEARKRWDWKLVYDCMDEHSGFSNNRRTMLRPERALIKYSDLVIATSRILYDKVSSGGRKALLLPNAVDFDYFHRPGPLRPLDGIPRPIIGYYGAISDWFDVKMIRKAAAARPDWHFVLIGDTAGANVSPLKRLNNVHLIGEQPYITLPSYLKQFDVACIPFLITCLTRATNPVKFYEYLSLGKPIVAVELPDLEPYRDYFYPVRSIADFVPQIEAALSERSPEKVQARIEFARQNTWLDRYKILSENIEQCEKG